MTYDNFIHLIKHPQEMTENHQTQLKEMMEQFPYFGLAKWLYLKSLKESDSIYFNQELKKTALYAPIRRNLYYFIHPEEITTHAAAAKERNHATGSYFDMIDLLEAKEDESRGSLQSLAERLRAARETLNPLAEEAVETKNDVVEEWEDTEFQSAAARADYFAELEDLAKKMIREQKYEKAIRILEKLNLNNPKKSIYFADQIRFLKKINKT